MQAQLTEAFRQHGLPDQLLWDNGPPWGCGGEAYTTLDVWALRLGVRVCHGRAYHPQTQGKEERFHRTLQAEVLARGGWTDCAHVRRAFDAWRPVYNTQRPHEALALAVPLSRYQDTEGNPIFRQALWEPNPRQKRPTTPTTGRPESGPQVFHEELQPPPAGPRGFARAVPRPGNDHQLVFLAGLGQG